MSQINFNRIVYSPEVQVYILPGDSDTPIDISNDIIEGNITRRTEAVSTASFLVQSRKNKENEMLLSQLLRPMDRIVVYLKKTKPILIFSGYLDLVPVFQAMPEPFTIEASCTLKRLEFTYWDPGLPKVYETLQKYGFVPKLSEGGISFFDPNALSPIDLATTPSANGTQQVGSNTSIQDTGFAAMLNFLLVDVGGWNPDNVWIEPLPEAWMQRAALLFQVNNDWQDRYNLAQDWLKTFLTAGGSSGGGDGGGGGGNESPSASSAKLTNRSQIVSIINQNIKKNQYYQTDVTGEDFVKYGENYNIDPRFLAAVAAAETHYGTNGQGQAPEKGGYYNMFGLGKENRAFPSRVASIKASAQEIRQPKPNNYYLNGDPNQTVDGWIVNWTQNNQEHKNNVISFWKQMANSANPVDPTKPYSITGQGIGSASEPQTNPNTPNANNPSSNTGGSNTSLSVYIEAGHSDPRQPGYQNQAGDGTTYRRSNGKAVVERDANIAVVKEIERLYNALPQVTKDKININFAYTSRPQGWAGDVYISIHHDAATYNDNKIGMAYPSKDSRQGNLSKDPGLPGPNQYSDGGTGWTLPESGEGGRNIISEDNGLHKNSAQLANIFGEVASNISGKSVTGARDGARKGMRNYYGFYYTNSSAALITELPSDGTRLQYDITKMANSFLTTVIKYQDKVKAKNLQESIASGTEGAGGSGQINLGDDTPASKVIAAIRLAVDHNDTEGNWDLGYSMGIGGPANIPSRNDKATIEEVMAKTREQSRCFDCSSFIGAAMRSAGLISKNENQLTGNLESNSTIIADKTAYKPGHLFVSNTGAGGGHVCIVVSADGQVAECTRPDTSANYGERRGPQYSTVKRFIESDRYKLCEHNKIGTTTNPPSGGSSSGSGEGGTGSVNSFLLAKTVAFNVAFNFPGSLLESILLTGDRALENDVKLFESVGEICKASMRTFASLPNGDFMAWYPDYFNLSQKNPWLRVNTTEIKSCTISLSDRQLVTHVYVLGNPFGLNQSDASNIRLEWYEKLLGSGVVTIERPYILDSFLRPFENEDLTKEDIETLEDTSQLSADQIKSAKKRPRGSILEGQGSAYKFLERYGARPYLEKIPTIRHPIFEFFYAYHTFIQKWAEQFITRVELTFMPELFPGMIVELDVNPQIANYPKTSVTFYVKEVTHSFSYQNGFYTEALLMAPGTTNKGNQWAMALVAAPDQASDGESKRKRVRVKIPPKTRSRTGNSAGAARPGTGSGQSGTSYEPADAQDGDD